MARELLILRHGKSDWGLPLADFDRPLKKRGKRAARRIGRWLREGGVLPDLVVTSPARRAIDTARLCAKELNLSPESLHRDERIYEAGLDALLAVVDGLPDVAERVLLVGHNPGLEELLRALARTPPPLAANGKLLPTASLARLAFDGVWGQAAAARFELLALVRPRELEGR